MLTCFRWVDYGRLDAPRPYGTGGSKVSQPFPLDGYDLIIKKQKRILSLNLYDSGPDSLVDYAVRRKNEISSLKRVRKLNIFAQTSSEVLDASPIFAENLTNLKEISIFMHQPSVSSYHGRFSMHKEESWIRHTSMSQYNLGAPKIFATYNHRYYHYLYRIMTEMTSSLLGTLSRAEDVLTSKLVRLDLFGAIFDWSLTFLNKVNFSSLRHLALLQCSRPGPFLDQLRNVGKLRTFEYTVAEYRGSTVRLSQGELKSVQDFLGSFSNLEKVLVRTEDTTPSLQLHDLNLICNLGISCHAIHLRVLMLTSATLSSAVLGHLFCQCLNLEVLAVPIYYRLSPLLEGLGFSSHPMVVANGAVMCNYLVRTSHSIGVHNES